MKWEVIIGLEVHTQLATQSKIFSGASTQYGAEPNTQACALDLALPGTLPVLNEQAVAMAIKFGLAVEAELNKHSVFARKNYFYPDLPKGYQISQYEHPIVGKGHLDVQLDDGSIKRIGITRAHLEEDAGKSLHEDFSGMSAIDLNRAGTPLLEIVSEPDMRSAKEAVAYLKTLHSLVRYLGISDGNMQEGSFRCDVNISLRPEGQEKFGTRAEIKNVNSFRFVERAIEYEIERQKEILENGGMIIQETRLFDSAKGETRSLRSKENAHDYRYFPDPDLLPLEFDALYVEALKAHLPELPDEKKARFRAEYGLSPYDADVLAAERESAEYFEAVAKGRDAKIAANWVINELFGRLNKEGKDIVASPVDAFQLGAVLDLMSDGVISGKIAKDLFEIVWTEGGDPRTIVEQRGMKQVTDLGAIEKVVDDIIAKNPDKVADAKSKPKAVGWFVGQAMKASGGKANPKAVNDLLAKKLGL
jgi:aspartyl-tRNA(Asn)/glutamyl-tRNA(Gln) amidotransferase subunit B